MSGDCRGTIWTLLVTFCIVINWYTENFWSPCTNRTRYPYPNITCTNFMLCLYVRCLQELHTKSITSCYFYKHFTHAEQSDTPFCRTYFTETQRKYSFTACTFSSSWIFILFFHSDYYLSKIYIFITTFSCTLQNACFIHIL
jgi:hypothetical protein